MAQTILMSTLIDRNLQEIANKKLYEFVADKEKINENVITSTIILFQKNYYIQFIKDLRIIYLRDITEQVNLEKKYLDRTLAFGYINIDNLEEALSGLDVQGKSDCQGRILNAIVKWTENFGGFVRAFSDSKLMLITDYEHLNLMIENDFSILDDVKLLLKTTKAVYITLSIGIVCEDLPIEELTKIAEDQLDLALNRGGDQAIVKIDGIIKPFGAKKESFNKAPKVEMRLRYQEIETSILSSSVVFCTGHILQDADSFGSTVAIYNLAVSLGKQAYIIFDELSIDATVKKVYDDVKNYHRTLYKALITPEKAVELVDEQSLLIVVDCQSEKQVILKPKQFSAFKQVGVIDHHRKNEAGSINDTKFYVCESSASSCVELIFSMLEFSDVEFSISDNEATWMLLGMIVDTNNFAYRTSETTFEIAATLARMQASMGKVKEYLRDKMDEKMIRNRLVTDVEIYRSNIAIAKQSDNIELEAATLAKVADELLSIEGIILAITCGHTKGNAIKISARSLGKVNCQVLMEKLGGGGHLAAAAVVIPSTSMADVIRNLKNAIDEVLKEENLLKIILTEDVKDKGLKGEILSVENFQGKLLIDNKQAIEATAENVRLLEQEKREEQEAIALSLRKYYELKTEIEKEPLKIQVRMDENGHILDVVNAKVIELHLKRKIKHKIEYQKIIFNSNVTSLGLYEAQLQLNKDIFATITIFVVEKVNDDKD